MFRTILKISILALALPLSALAANHGHLLNRRHADLAKHEDANFTLERRGPNSRWSYYDVQTGAAGSCGRYHVNSDFTVALNAHQMNPSLCFRRIVLTWRGKTTTADITDTCPGCPYNGLDLTEGLFTFFAPQTVGIIFDGQWDFVGASPPPATTTTRPPPPPPTTTSRPPPPPTTSSVVTRPPTTSSSLRPSSSVFSSNSTSSSRPAASPTTIPPSTNNLEGMNQAFIQFGGLIGAGNKLSA